MHLADQGTMVHGKIELFHQVYQMLPELSGISEVPLV